MNNIFSAIEMSYSQYTSSVINYLTKTFSDFGKKYNNSTIFGQLITIITSTVQSIMLYIEDAFTEQNKFTALRAKSIYSLAEISGYYPSLGKSAGVQLKLSWKPSNLSNYNVILQNHTPLTCSANGLTYQIVMSQEAITLSVDKDNSTKYLYAVEGSFETVTAVADGGLNYTHHVDVDGNIDEDYMTLSVNGTQWTRVASLYDMEPNSNQWYYKPSVLGGVILGFGNYVHGNPIKSGDVIMFTYLRHSGEYGNFNNAEEVTFKFSSNLYDLDGSVIDGNDILNIKLASNDSITSGTNAESSSSVKQMIGYNSRAMVLASAENYAAYLNRFSFVGYNRTWSDTGSLMIKSLVMKNYNNLVADGSEYFKLTESDFTLSSDQKQSIISNINNSGRQIGAVTYDLIDPELCKYSLYVYIKLLSGYDESSVYQQVKSRVGTFFSTIANNDLYVPKSDLIQYIKNNVSGIDGLNCYFISERNEQAIIKKQYTKKTTIYDYSTQTYKSTEETVHLYDGEDPGLGLDAHGNIVLENDEQYPVLMGGWSYKNPNDNSLIAAEPIVISFE